MINRQSSSAVDSIDKGLREVLIRRRLAWSHPDRVSGDLLFQDTRVPISLFLRFLSENKIEEFGKAYPSVSKEKIMAVSKLVILNSQFF